MQRGVEGDGGLGAHRLERERDARHRGQVERDVALAPVLGERDVGARDRRRLLSS